MNDRVRGWWTGAPRSRCWSSPHRWRQSVWLLQFVSTSTLWWLYVGVLIFLAYRMAFPPKQDDSAVLRISDQTRAQAGAASAGISVFAGLLGVWPGFLLMPALVMFGYTARRILCDAGLWEPGAAVAKKDPVVIVK